MIVVRMITKSLFSKDSSLPPMVRIIALQFEKFEKISLFHVLRHLIGEADTMANLVVEFKSGTIETNAEDKGFTLVP